MASEPPTLETPVVRSLALMAVATLCVAAPAPPDAVHPPPRVVEVRMVDKSTTEFAFEPAEIVVHPGDVVRFVQVGLQPHNVEFRGSPEGAELGDVRVGPYLLQKGQTYEVAIDGRFPPGAYPFVCTPHEFLGMKGTLTVSVGPPSPSPEHQEEDR